MISCHAWTILLQFWFQNLFILTRDFNKYNIANFQMSLSYEQWQDVFGVNDVNIMFKNFLNTYLRCYHSSFPITKKYMYKHTQNEWITKGITVSCKRKKELFILCKIYSNQWLRIYYKQHCAILTRVINNAKKLYYNNVILKSSNKMTATWKIINKEKGKTQSEMLVPQIIHESKLISNKKKSLIYSTIIFCQ